MNIAEIAAELVLTDHPSRYPPPGLSIVSQQSVYFPSSREAYYAPPPDSNINIHAPEWVPQSVQRQTLIDSSMEEAKRNLTHAYAFAKHAKKIAEDATNAAKMATDAAHSATESVEKAAKIVRDLQKLYDYPVLPAKEIPVSTVRAIFTAARVAPPPVASRDGNKTPTSPIVAPVKLRRGTKYCFEKQQGRPCKPNNGKPCKWCK
jgi:hypothetical protein